MRKVKTGTVFFIAIVVLLVNGCAVKIKKPKLRPPNYNNPIKTVAVLPMVNISDNVEGPQMIRKLFYQSLPGFNYEVKPMKEVNDILENRMGISLGKQLEMTTPQKLGEELGVDGILYGYLINFDEITAGVYSQKKVRYGWKLVNAKTGEIVWSKGVAVKRDKKIAGWLGWLAKTASDHIEDDVKVSALPTSKYPMKEMQGLGKWVVMETDTVDTSHGCVYDTCFSLLGSMFSNMVGNSSESYLKEETKFGLKMLFSRMLIGPVKNPTLIKQ